MLDLTERLPLLQVSVNREVFHVGTVVYDEHHSSAVIAGIVLGIVAVLALAAVFALLAMFHLKKTKPGEAFLCSTAII